MKVCLVSRDRIVERLCRESLARLCGTDWNLYWDPDGCLDIPVDLAILDLDAFSGAVPESICNGASHILLYSQERMQAVQGPLPAATILLKPLQRELFQTVLSCAIQRRSVQSGSGAATSGDSDPRNQGDELLQCLLHANVDLQRFHARQMNFLARGLHDLRAPLTAIEGYSSLLLEERSGPLTAEQRENLRRMQRSIGRLSRMTTDMFRLSLGQRGEREPDLQPGDFEACIRQTLQEMIPVAEGKKIRIVEDIAPLDEPLYFDHAQIQSVVANLLENAFRFTPRSGSVDVVGYSVFWERRRGPSAGEMVPFERRRHERHRPNAYRIDVRDSGPGISAEELRSIFEPYISYSGSKDRAGSGLGLAICRMVVSAHRGRIFAESNQEGAQFSFVLPVRPPPPFGPRRALESEFDPAKPADRDEDDRSRERA